MSVCGRRYDSGRINIIKYNSKIRKQENSLYSVIDFNERNVSFFIDDHTDYIILFIINCWKKNFITKYECNKLIDKVEGYYFGYEEELINALQLYHKLNKEIMRDYLGQKDWDNKIGVFLGRDKIDFNK